LRRVRRSDRKTDWGLRGGFRSVDRLWVGTGVLSTAEMVGIEENWTVVLRIGQCGLGSVVFS
jgi:hypothetical protein